MKKKNIEEFFLYCDEIGISEIQNYKTSNFDYSVFTLQNNELWCMLENSDYSFYLENSDELMSKLETLNTTESYSPYLNFVDYKYINKEKFSADIEESLQGLSKVLQKNLLDLITNQDIGNSINNYSENKISDCSFWYSIAFLIGEKLKREKGSDWYYEKKKCNENFYHRNKTTVYNIWKYITEEYYATNQGILTFDFNRLYERILKI